MKEKIPTQIYQIKVTLKNISPPIWRRILVSDKITLLELHDILQAVFGWQDYHLHEFTIHDVQYGDPANDEFDDYEIRDEVKTKLRTLNLVEGTHFTYEYDFGGSWEHVLLVERILQFEKGMKLSQCIKGKRACPPEDVGGVWGYEGFLEAIRDSKNEDHESTLEWIGGKFDSEAFDLEEVNERLRLRMKRDWNGGLEAEVGIEPALETMFDPSRLTGLFTEISEKAAQALPLRQDAVTLLTYIRDNKVTGTQSTGNLPLKVVADVAAHFVAPPALETQIGETVFRFRTEEDVWPVFFAHVLLQGAGLINGGPGRRWRLAQSGEKFLMAPPVVQSWILFTTWWRQINWLIAYPIGAFGDILPQDFAQSVLEALKELSIDQPTPIEALAERVLKAVAWIWPHQTPETIHSIVYSSVEQMVVDPLEEIGVLTTKRTNDPTRLLNIRKLETFSLTFFGRALLDSI